ncbi:MAG: tetratricopeptide repeat protein, partial [Nitrospiria bacterium]
MLFLIILTGCSSAESKKAKHLARAEDYIQEEKFPEAIIEYRNAIQIDPEDAETQYKLGIAHLKIGDLPHIRQAFAALNTSLEMNPGNTDAHLKIGMLHTLAGDYKKAIEKGKIVTEKEPENVEGYLLLGNGLVRQKTFEPAITAIKKAIQLDPKRIGAYINLGDVYVAQQNMNAAEKSYKEAVKKISKMDILSCTLIKRHCIMLYGKIRWQEAQTSDVSRNTDSGSQTG